MPAILLIIFLLLLSPHGGSTHAEPLCMYTIPVENAASLVKLPDGVSTTFENGKVTIINNSKEAVYIDRHTMIAQMDGFGFKKCSEINKPN